MDDRQLRRALGIGDRYLQINADLVAGKTNRMESREAELRLLEAWNFIDYERDEPHKSGNFRIDYPGARGTNLAEAMAAFLLAEGLSAFTLFSTMNFAPFGPAPAAGHEASPSKIRAKKPPKK